MWLFVYYLSRLFVELNCLFTYVFVCLFVCAFPVWLFDCLTNCLTLCDCVCLLWVVVVWYLMFVACGVCLFVMCVCLFDVCVCGRV